jgi:myotubularin-related protein 6/7/8
VPSVVSDNTLKHTASFRSKTRIPVLTYLHSLNDCAITRSAQPSAGIRGLRSPQDEKLVNAIFHTTRPSSKAPQLGTSGSQQGQSASDLSAMINETADAIDSVEIGTTGAFDSQDSINVESLPTESDTAQIVQIYGAQQTNMIIDARPSVNAMAQQAIGYGSENMEGYPTAKKLFLGIDNIHVMRKSIEEVIEALKDSDLTTLPPLYAKLDKSGWRKHIGMILSGALIISNTIAIQHSHVLIHCSDGWDRTSQLSALSQICLDPYYRTMEGFMVLIEKDWMSFCHMFRLRSGLLHHEKWFEMENERVITNRSIAQNNNTEAPDGAVNAFENAIAKAQGFFRRKMDPLDDPDGDNSTTEASPSKFASPKKDEKMATKPKEMSPVFHQFLDATYQLLRQYPTRFEFNERFLRRLFYHVYSCQYGNFLYNSEKERVDAKAKQKTHSVWGYFLSKRSQFTNDQYDRTIDENDKDKTSLIEPRPHDIKWWHELFGRTESEMNGPISSTNSTFTSDLNASTVSEGNDPSSSSELTAADGSSASSQFGTMTVNTMSTARNGDITSRFARMEERSSNPITVFSAASLNSTSDPLTDPSTNSSWIPATVADKRKDQIEVELR